MTASGISLASVTATDAAFHVSSCRGSSTVTTRAQANGLQRLMLALQKKQRLVKAGSAEKGSKGRASIRNDSTQLDDVVEQAMPRKQPSMRTPQQPHKQKHELEAESDDDDASAPVITGYVSLASMGWRIPQTIVVGMIHTDRDYLFDLRLGPLPSAAVPVVATIVTACAELRRSSSGPRSFAHSCSGHEHVQQTRAAAGFWPGMPQNSQPACV